MVDIYRQFCSNISI